MPIIIKKIPVGPLETNCYVVSCEVTGFTFIIDPGDSPRVIINYIRRNEFIPKAIVLTHGHPDHTSGVKLMSGELNIPIFMHKNDLDMLRLVNINSVDKYLNDGDILTLGRENFKIIHTPGHTLGGICILNNGILFSGDTLFKNGVGRTDLPGGSQDALENSLKNKLFILPPETIVYPGHGPETTIKEESAE